MVFSSVIFLFLFFPLVMAGYWLCGRKFQNLFLLTASLFFYAWGEGIYVGVMLCSIVVNWGIGVLIDRFRESYGARNWMVFGVVFNLLVLSYFKYSGFFLENLNHFLGSIGQSTVAVPQVHLPIGVSFFTFQAMTYVVDIYRNQGQVQKNPFNVGLYISLFPQLIAGPIVRYREIAAALDQRVVRFDDVIEGVERFILGLGKKVLIANHVAVVADAVFGLPMSDVPMGLAWSGILAYTIQIYFDFSGYSDMAIGIGRMLGFRFPENFQLPYGSLSMREFWQRWHMTLSNWFRDYLYIPMGGNRGGILKTCRNLFVVFFLCGLWHGASWSFIVWGLWHGMFLALERIKGNKGGVAMPAGIRHLYVMLVVMVGWVFFRSPALTDAMLFLKAMGGAASSPDPGHFSVLRDGVFWTAIAFGVVFSLPVTRAGFAGLRKRVTGEALYCLLMGGVLVMSVMSLSSGAYNPFIYFRF